MNFEMSGSVKDLIRAIRSSKTAAEERAILSRECASIRGSLFTDSLSNKRKNITKLLLIQLLGHYTNFGQLECIKLLASSKFTDKRVGYLALHLLLTEDTEVLTLAINSIKMDLNSSNPYVVEMALQALANVGNEEMFQELQYEIERLLKSNIPNIRKKAAICAARMLRIIGQVTLVPDARAIELARLYYEIVPSMLVDTNHGVIAAGLTIFQIILDHYTQVLDQKSGYHLLIKTLKGINESGQGVGMMFSNSKEYEINGVNDPFLQIKFLVLIRKLHLKCRETEGSDHLYDLVSRIIANCKGGTNSIHSLLYECIRTIYCEFGNERFDQLGRDVVSRFMASNDNNIKYIALGILNNFTSVKMTVGDTNWNIVVQSLRQPDISIRKRALEVALELVNSNTISALMQHLYDFLLTADAQLKRASIPKIAKALKSHGTSSRYILETLVKIFTIAGNYVSDDIFHDFIACISAETLETQTEATRLLYCAVRNNFGQEVLVRAALWCLGEFAIEFTRISLENLAPISIAKSVFRQHPGQNQQQNHHQQGNMDLLNLDDPTPKYSTSEHQPTSGVEPSGNPHVSSLLEAIAKHFLTGSNALNAPAPSSCGEYLLSCIGKLLQKLPEERQRLLKLLQWFKSHPNVELQQRACEIDLLVKEGLTLVLAAGPRTLLDPYNNSATPSSASASSFCDYDDGATDKLSQTPRESQAPLDLNVEPLLAQKLNESRVKDDFGDLNIF